MNFGEEVGPLDAYPYSSYQNYLGKRTQEWIKPNEILKPFSTTNPTLSYRYFVEETNPNYEKISHLTLDI